MAKQTFLFLLIAYFILLLLLMSGMELSRDSYYYWHWGNNLALSYYDGPPLIAYSIKLFTTIFGQHRFSILLIGYLSAIISSLTLYKISQELFNKTTAQWAVGFWLFNVTIVSYCFLEVSYNSLLIIFWGLLFYCALRLFNTKKTYYYYLCGLFTGLLLLSKYTGVLLILSLIIISIANKNFRFIWKNINLYLSFLLALLIFSPVIYWNLKNNNLGFLFQLNHGFMGARLGWYKTLFIYLGSSLIAYHAIFILFIFFIIKNFKKIIKNNNLIILLIPSMITWGFFLISSCFSRPLLGWNSPFLFTAVILVSYFLNQKNNYKYKIIKYFVLIFSLLLTIVPLLMYRAPAAYLGGGGVFQSLAETNTIRTLIQQVPPAFYNNNYNNKNNNKILIFAHSYHLLSYLSAFLLNNNKNLIFGDSFAAHQFYLDYLDFIKNDNKNKKNNNYSALYFAVNNIDEINKNILKNCVLIYQITGNVKLLFYPDYPLTLLVQRCGIIE